MGKLIRRLKIGSFVAILIELAFLIAFLFIYFFNAFNIQSSLQGWAVLIIAASIVLINVIFLWVVILKVSSLRQQTDLRAAEVIGSDVQEAYNFAQVGLAVTDDNDTVLWTNDLFISRHIEIIDINILAWKNELAVLKDPANKNSTVKIEQNDRQYEVKYLAEAGLWIFKDISDLEENIRYNREQAPVIGILNIDNYEELIHGEDDFNDSVTKLKNVIFNYCKEYGILLRRLKDGVYSMLCNYKSFCGMKDDKFSILDKAREISRGAITPITISIGIAYDFPDVTRLNEMANSVLDIAMSRGGDQVVISAYGSEMEFIGGKSEAQEKRYKVQVRVFADSLSQLIRNSDNILVMGHTEMDMDALGACLGIKAICDRFSKPCRVVADLRKTEAKTKAAMNASFSREELGEIFVSCKDADSLIQAGSLLVVVDVHIPSMVMEPSLLEKINKVVVIDHHRRAEEFIESPVFNHIDSSASSTSEIITEFIRFSTANPMITIPPAFATIMLSGIFLDSGFYRSKSTGIRTFEASTILKEFGADNSLADDFLKDDYEEIAIVNHILTTLKTQSYGVVYATGDEDVIYDRTTLAKAANECLKMKGIHASFIFGKTGPHEVRMSCRSDGVINVQFLAEKLGGGGHYTSAAVRFEKDSIQEVEAMLNDVLKEFLVEAKNTDNSRIIEGGDM